MPKVTRTRVEVLTAGRTHLEKKITYSYMLRKIDVYNSMKHKEKGTTTEVRNRLTYGMLQICHDCSLQHTEPMYWEIQQRQTDLFAVCWAQGQVVQTVWSHIANSIKEPEVSDRLHTQLPGQQMRENNIILSATFNLLLTYVYLKECLFHYSLLLVSFFSGGVLWVGVRALVIILYK